MSSLPLLRKIHPRWYPWLIVLPFLLWALSGLRIKGDKAGTFAFQEFGKLPVLTNGRVQPIDSLARNSLLQLREKTSANAEPWKSFWQGPRILSASEWALEMMTNPTVADTRPVFRIDHPQLKSLLGLPAEATTEPPSDGKNFTWGQIKTKLEELQNEARRIGQIDSSKRDPYDRAVSKLWNGVAIYMRLQNTLQPQNAKAWGSELQGYLSSIQAGVAAARAQKAGQPFDKGVLDRTMDDLQRFDGMAQLEPPMLIPPANPAADRSAWQRSGTALMEVARGSEVPAALPAYARMADAFRNNQPAYFNQAIADYRSALERDFSPELDKCVWEQRFNSYSPFIKALSIYLLAGLLVLFYWFRPLEWEVVRKSAMGLILLALAIHTSGLFFRMLLEGRPPVTNLYSSAIFIGFGACILGVILELVWRNGIGVLVSSVVGFSTLIIAHHLSLSGDTMEMMRAVLDSNFWLATHVVVITLGYSATFVAGFLAIVYILRGVFTTGLSAETGKSLAKMVYGVVCFATLFSFIGTVLGGIWADQSWGRFWGWDPKENGALIIVLWNAIVLHARWGGMVKERGLMNLVVVGNIVTAWSWFGVNMLGVGLHSYGFTDAAFFWLSSFGISQLAIICLGMLPRRTWRSAAELSRPSSTTPPLPA